MPIRYLLALLVCEGVSDEWFLPTLLQRAIQQICDEGRTQVQVDIEVIAADHQRPDAVVGALGRAPRFEVLLYHHDGAPTAPAQAKIDEIRRCVGAVRREPVVAVVPVRETEAWLLADSAALADVLGVPVAGIARPLGPRPRDVESIPDPKKTLNSLTATARGSRLSGSRRQTDRPDFYTAVAENLDLDRLRQVPSFQRWWDEMAQALEKMGFHQ